MAADDQQGARPALARVLAARTPADLAAATLDLHADDAERAHAGAASPITAAQYRAAYGSRVNHYPGPWPGES